MVLAYQLCIRLKNFREGRKYGHLAMLLTEAKYRDVINNPQWAYDEPTNQGAYNPMAVNTINAAQKEQMITTHNCKNESSKTYLGVEEGGKELIIYAVVENAVAPLSKQYIDFGEITIKEMIRYLWDRGSIRITSMEINIYKRKCYGKQWNMATNIVI